MKYLWLLSLFIALDVSAAIGTMNEVQGTAIEIKRKQNAITGKANVGIESMDSISVGSKSQVGITFNDNSKVKITENSKLVIDDFVYDPKNSDASKVGMKVALGTVKMASGQIAKNNPQQVNIKTPTATIAVRGTDFAMTVDEAGRSIVALLPSCDDDRKLLNFQISGNCKVGQIDVSTDAGIVTLTQPYTATYVTDASQPPLPPVSIDPIAVSNESLIKKPETIAKAENERDQRKEEQKDKSKTNEDEKKTSRDALNEKNALDKKNKDNEETKLIGLNGASGGALGDPKTNPCWPFNDCGNEKGLNWYYRKDDDRGNTIVVKSGEKMDNTTYNISINSNDVDTRVVGDGSNKVTVRIWNR
jgi:hypothetical protein